MGHGGEFWQNVVHQRREWQTTSVFLPWEPHEQYERQKDRILQDELPRSIGAQYATGGQWRNNFRKNEGTESKHKQHPIVDVTGDGSKVWCYRQQYCIGTWNVRSVNQGKLEVVKQKITIVHSSGGSDGKASFCNAGDPGSIPGSGRFPGEGNGNPLQYSCLENSMDWGAWWAIVHGVTKSQTWLSNFTFK